MITDVLLTEKFFVGDLEHPVIIPTMNPIIRYAFFKT